MIHNIFIFHSFFTNDCIFAVLKPPVALFLLFWQTLAPCLYSPLIFSGGGVQYSPVTITSYPHKDIIDPKERPFFAHVPNFCFPDAGGSEPPKQTELDETYSFIFTDDKGAQMFGYCRRIWPDDALGSPNKSGRVSVVSATSTQSATSGMSKLHDEDLPTVYCIISQQRCFELFDKVSNQKFFSTK